MSDQSDTAIQHLRDSPGVRVKEQDRPNDPRDIYEVYVNLPVLPGHVITKLYNAGFEVSIDFTEPKLIVATLQESDPDERWA